TWALTISSKWWSNVMKDQSKMGAAPGNSTNMAPPTVEEGSPTTVNVAGLERIGDMLMKMLRTEQQQQQNYVQEIRDKVSTLLDGVELNRSQPQSSELTTLKLRISDLEKQVDNLKALWLAAA